MEESKIIRILTRKITFFRNLNFILDGSEINQKNNQKNTTNNSYANIKM